MEGIMNITKAQQNIFEKIKHFSDDGQEYWCARELAQILDYSEYRHFKPVVEKAKKACTNSNYKLKDHFEEVLDMVEIGSGAERQLDETRLSRYACYLIVQNGDPRKEIIARGQTYFAIQTRRQELENDSDFKGLSEDKKRLLLRNELREQNKNLASAAKDAGVKDGLEFAVFQDHGYKGLYGGLKAKDIHTKKKLKKSQQILDYMGSTELAANLFRTTQTEDKLRREKVKGKTKANQTHYEVGKKVRETIEELGGTMPEKLPVAETSIKQIEKRVEN